MSEHQSGDAAVTMLHQATSRRRNQRKKYKQWKTWKQREKANRELLRSSRTWMKAHFIEHFTHADRPNEEDGALAWLHTLTTELSGYQIHIFAENMLWLLFVFYTVSCSPSLLLWFVKLKPLIKHQIKRMHIRKAFFIPAFEQSQHFTYFRYVNQLKGFTGQICFPSGYLFP